MSHWVMIAGLGCGLGGALMVAVGDSWLSCSLLIYLDAIEENVASLVKAIRTGSTDLVSTGINLVGLGRAGVLSSSSF